MSIEPKFPALLPYERGDNDDTHVYVFAKGKPHEPFALIPGVSDESEAVARELIRRWNAHERLVELLRWIADSDSGHAAAASDVLASLS